MLTTTVKQQLWTQNIISEYSYHSWIYCRMWTININIKLQLFYLHFQIKSPTNLCRVPIPHVHGYQIGNNSQSTETYFNGVAEYYFV